MADDGASKVGDTWIKVSGSRRKYARELEFHRLVAPVVGDVAPLLDARPDRLELVYAHVDGRRGDARDHGAAGAWLRRLHAVGGVPDDPLDLADAMRARWDRWWPLAAPALDAGERARLVAWFEPVPGTRTWCHRDFREPNWIVGERLVVVDLEHAGPDGPLADLVKLAPRWLESPAAEEAFREAYGPWDDRALGAWVALWVVGTLGWAARHGDATFAPDAHAVLAGKARSR